MTSILLLGLAHATPNFIDVLAEVTGADLTTSDCALCHTDGRTGLGTVNTPFGTSMRSRGLVAYDEDALRTAVAALDAEGTDSDGDGVGDIDEVRDGTDPNTAEGVQKQTPEYGCLQAAPVAPHALWALAALTLACLRRGRP